MFPWLLYNFFMDSKIKVGILSVGLIGSSILKGLSKNPKYELFVFSNSSFAKALDYTKNSSSDLDILKNCEIIFVCSNVSKTVFYLDKLDKILDKNAVVVDVTSIKNDLINRKYNFNFILSHPMAGTEKSGFDSGFSELFLNSKWLYEKENPVLIQIIKDLGAIPTKINMLNHDKMCAQISHLTTILAFLVFQNASNDAKKIASSGFRDMTRLAKTNPDLALNMLNLNLDNIEQELKNILERFNNLKNLSDDEKIKIFNEINEKRALMYDEFGKNIL